jgi:putative urate catabolism protein
MAEQIRRDMVGYGRTPPDPQWPGGARLALSFVLNYEEGAENWVPDGDAGSESYLHEIIGVPPLIGERNLNIESVYEYGSRAGFWRIHRLFGAHGMPLTVYAAGLALERNPDAARAMAEAGWEVASHGWRWFDYSIVPEDEEREHIRKVIEAGERLVGHRPVGWYCGRMSRNTRRLIAEEGGFLYDSDDYSDDLPYWTEVEGKPYLILPYSLDNNDFKFLINNGFTSSDQFFTYLKDAFDLMMEEGRTTPKMMSVGLHCRISGRPGRARALERFLDYVAGFPDAWVTTREQIALHWRKVHPFGG